VATSDALSRALPELRSLVYSPSPKYPFTLSAGFLAGKTVALTQLGLHDVRLDDSAAFLAFPSFVLFDFLGVKRGQTEPRDDVAALW
jgi:hypothetical protein